jgi:hypothetical protein
VTVDEQTLAAAAFFGNAAALLSRKGRDYAPEDVVFLDVVMQSAMAEVSPEIVMWVMLQKHLTAVRRFVVHGSLDSEAATSRFTDVANFVALLDFFNLNREKILLDIQTHLILEPCALEPTSVCNSDDTVCDRCRALHWVRRLQNGDYSRTDPLWQQTRRIQASSGGESREP